MSVQATGGPLEFNAVINDSDFKAQINRMEASLKGLTQTANSQADAMENYAKKVSLAIGGYLSLSTGTNFVKDVVTVRGEFQKLEVSFKTMLKSKERADELMQQAVQLAAQTPFTLQDVGSGAKQLLAYGIAAEKTVDTLRMLGNVASGVGAPLNDIVYLYGTLQTQGRAYTRDIMQFTSRGIPVIDELAKQFGIAKEEVQSMVEAGKVGFPDIEKAFKSLTSSGGIFFNLMEEQSKTLTGQISNLQDAWSRMLNDIGKSNEGVLSDLIVSATGVVNNYQNVVDVLKVLVITYGSYRAALIALSVVEGIQANMVKGYTLLETLRFRAMVVSESAMKLLNTTMLSNPAIAIATGITALVSALIIFSKEANKATKAQESINEVSSEARKNIELEKNKLLDLVKVATDETRSKKDRESAIKRINEISPEYLNNISLETIRTKEGQKAIDDYIKMLEKKATAQAVQSKLDELFKKKLDQEIIQSQLKVGKQNSGYNRGQMYQDAFAQLGIGEGSDAYKFSNAKKEIGIIDSQIDALRNKYKNVVESNLLGNDKPGEGAKPRSLTIIDEEIKSLQELQKKSINAKQYQEYQIKINELEKERQKITGLTKKQIDSENRSMNEKRDLLDAIAKISRESNQSGLIKEQSEIEKVNEKYDELFNKIAEFNKLNPKGKIGQVAINQLNSARSNELSNTEQKQGFEQYKQNLETQEKLFQEYEVSKTKIGIEQADKLFSSQLKGFKSYGDFLNSQKELYLNMAMSGDASIGTQLKLNEVIKRGNEYQNKEIENSFNKQVQDIELLLSITQSVNERRLNLEKKYNSDLSILRKQFSGDELKRREQALYQQYAQEKQSIDSNSASRNPFFLRIQLEQKYLQDSDALKEKYRGKELNQKLTDLKTYYDHQADYISVTFGNQGEAITSLLKNINQYTAKELSQYIESLKQVVKGGTIISDGTEIKIPPELLAQLQEYIFKLEEVQKTSKSLFGMTKEDMMQFNKYADLSRHAFSELASTIEPFNKGLSDTLKTMNDIVSAAQGAANLGFGIATGSIEQMVSGSMQLISSVAGIIGRSRESERKAREEVAAFQNKILASEIETNILYRERERSQIRLNQLKLEGIKKESDALKKQSIDNAGEFQRIVGLIQKEQYVSGQTTVRRGGFLGIGRTTQVVNEMASLAGLSYLQLEKLFNSGQLNDRAKELFQTLQKLKQDGIDIENKLRDLQKESQEVFTATTGDSIVNSLIEGFKQGKRSAADFADSFQELMQNAVLNALKYQTLEKPLQEFYNQFANFSQSGNILTNSEIEQLRKQYNSIINTASEQFKNLQQISGLGFGSANGNASNSSLAGAIKGISEDQANLLAGQFVGLRLTAIEQLNISRQSMEYLNAIANNTASIYGLHKKWDLQGLKVI